MQEEIPSKHAFVYSTEMVAFVQAASEAAAFLEDLKGIDGKEFIESAIIHFSSVYATILRTGGTEPVFETAGEPTVTEQDWSDIYKQVANLLGPYNEFLRPAEEGEFDRSELVTHTVSEDLADVYQELRDFTIIYSRGVEELMNDAAWELKVRFTEHWGKKLLRALSVLHDLYAAGTDPTEQ